MVFQLSCLSVGKAFTLFLLITKIIQLNKCMWDLLLYIVTSPLETLDAFAAPNAPATVMASVFLYFMGVFELSLKLKTENIIVK